MLTPAGKECRFFYGDYYRGRNHEECRLLNSVIPEVIWKSALCYTCPVPEIHLANACAHLVLEPRLDRPFLVGRQKVSVRTTCNKTQRYEFNPLIGCGECHSLPPVFSIDQK